MGVCFGDETEFGFAEFGNVGDYEVYVYWKVLEYGVGDKGHVPGQMLRASETITLICKGHSSILHAKYNAVAITRYGFVLRTSILI